MLSLQYAQMFPALQFSAAKRRITGTEILKSTTASNNKENSSVNYILLHKYLNAHIIFAICMNLYS